MKRLLLIVSALALLASWVVLGRAQAGPTPAQSIKGYMPLIAQPPQATITPTRTATATATGTVIPPPPPLTATATQTNVPTDCDPSYPGVCIPPPPPDLNCGDIPFRRFTVLPPDPHNFDTDNDGIGCESD